jgi:cardiolipin synthase
VALLDGAEAAWSAMLAAIAAAQRHVVCQVYAFYDDAVGTRFLDAFIAAAARGVTVEVELDAWGSMGVATRVAERLRAGGCRARVYHRLRLGLLGRLGRNHRKLLVVDAEVAFVGGINIGERFTDWADLAVEIRGPVSAALDRRLGGERRVAQPGAVRVHLSRLRGGRRLFRRYVKAIATARHSIVVAHAYFLPERRLVRALARAARRGVVVKLLLPAHSDLPLVLVAMRASYATLARAGVQLYEWRDSILHAKTAVVDARSLLVGSFNLDPLSLANLETLVVADDPEAASAGQRWIERRLERAVAVEQHPPWAERLLGRALALLLRMVALLLR